MKRECKFCHADMTEIPPTEAITRHLVGLCAPSRNEVEAAIEEFEWRNVMEAEMIRRQMTRQKSPPIEFTGRDLLWVIPVGSIVGAAFMYLLCWLRAL
jgi:hypothetical protein